MQIIEVHTRTPRPGRDAIAQIGKGKSAYKTTCTAGEKLAARNLVTKYYGAAAAETLRKTTRTADNGSAVWEFKKIMGPKDSTSEISSPAAASEAAPEHIAPGQLSKALADRLQEQGKSVSKESLVEIIRQTESSRAEYQVRAILTGVILLSKKSSLKHGQWGPFLEQLFQIGNGVSNLKCAVFDDRTAGQRILNIYMYLAKRFLWKIETNGFLNEAIESDKSRIACTANQVLELVTQQSPEEAPLFTEITRFVAGRSLRRMLADFRQAEKDAEDEAREEATAQTTSNHSIAENAPVDKQPIQLLLWEQFECKKLPIIDAVFDEPGTEDLHGEEAILHYTHIADALDERAKRARALAEAAREGRAKSR